MTFTGHRQAGPRSGCWELQEPSPSHLQAFYKYYHFLYAPGSENLPPKMNMRVYYSWGTTSRPSPRPPCCPAAKHGSPLQISLCSLHVHWEPLPLLCWRVMRAAPVPGALLIRCVILSPVSSMEEQNFYFPIVVQIKWARKGNAASTAQYMDFFTRYVFSFPSLSLSPSQTSTPCSLPSSFYYFHSTMFLSFGGIGMFLVIFS